MNAPKQPREKSRLKRPLVLIILGSLAIHFIAGLILGGVALFRVFQPEEAELEVAPAPESTEPQKREYRARSQRAQRSTALPTQMPLAVNEPAEVNLPDVDIPEPDRGDTRVRAQGSAEGLGEGFGSGSGGDGFKTIFGNTSPTAGALTGTFVDFKQDRNREPVDDPARAWMSEGDDFAGSWDVREFDRYFRAPQRLHATHFYIPLIDASAAPRAYGVENLVEPSHWAAAYEGQFISEAGGTYRFVGTADDILIVGVGERIVLSGGFPKYNPTDWSPREERRYPGPPVSQYLPELTFGDWFELPAGEPRDLNVVVGEVPGGEFASYLFIQKKGVDYETTADGRPILPVFKLKELSSSERSKLSADGYPKRLDGPVFGYY